MPKLKLRPPRLPQPKLLDSGKGRKNREDSLEIVSGAGGPPATYSGTYLCRGGGGGLGGNGNQCPLKASNLSAEHGNMLKLLADAFPAACKPF